jgi:hypothetical protein
MNKLILAPGVGLIMALDGAAARAQAPMIPGLPVSVCEEKLDSDYGVSTGGGVTCVRTFGAPFTESELLNEVLYGNPETEFGLVVINQWTNGGTLCDPELGCFSYSCEAFDLGYPEQTGSPVALIGYCRIDGC